MLTKLMLGFLISIPGLTISPMIKPTNKNRVFRTFVAIIIVTLMSIVQTVVQNKLKGVGSSIFWMITVLTSLYCVLRFIFQTCPYCSKNEWEYGNGDTWKKCLGCGFIDNRGGMEKPWWW